MSTAEPSDDLAASSDPFADLVEANSEYARRLATAGRGPLPARAERGLAVITCMDPRIDPSAALGVAEGDCVVLRNPGGRVTVEVLSALVLARHALRVERVAVVAHTDCRMASGDERALHETVAAAGGPDVRSLAFLTTADQRATLRDDVQRVRSWPYLPGLAVAGFLLDVASGRLEPVD